MDADIKKNFDGDGHITIIQDWTWEEGRGCTKFIQFSLLNILLFKLDTIGKLSKLKISVGEYGCYGEIMCWVGQQSVEIVVISSWWWRLLCPRLLHLGPRFSTVWPPVCVCLASANTTSKDDDDVTSEQWQCDSALLCDSILLCVTV